MYSDQLMRRFYHPTHVGELSSAAGTGVEGDATCGDVVQVSVELEDGVISGARFKTFGCAVAIAASEAVCELAEGVTPGVAGLIDVQQVMGVIGPLPGQRLSCAASAVEAVKRAARQAGAPS
ncbi:MAG: iron-sulfur cluster assembly scaffold protein [Actinomycetota bacterium]